MSTQADVHSIDALVDLRVSLALFAEDTLSALGAVDMELRRTVQWLQHDRRAYWQEQIKRRREQVAIARAEVFRRKLATRADYTPAYSEQKELLRKAEASLRDAEIRANLVKKWEPALQQAILEYHGSTRRISDLASGDVPRALIVLERMIEALEAYLRVAPPSGHAVRAALDSIANTMLPEDSAAESEPAAEQKAEAPAPAENATAPQEIPSSSENPEPQA